MLVSMIDLLKAADNYALGAFNVYNLEGVKAVLQAAEANHSPVILQIHPAALNHGGIAFAALCIAAAERATVSVGVHLDHCTDIQIIHQAIESGMTSVMADGSHLRYEENLAFTAEVVAYAHQHDVAVEAELGRISGTEDGLTVEEFEARLTDPEQATTFAVETGIDALAVCIGNVHGKYPAPPQFDFERLKSINSAVSVPLVLHGASGVPDAMVHQSITFGIRKFNVNTEVRKAYLNALRKGLMSENIDLIDLMVNAEQAMAEIVATKLTLFGSMEKAEVG